MGLPTRLLQNWQTRLDKRQLPILFYLTVIRQLTPPEQKSALSFVNRRQCNMSTVVLWNQSQFTSNSILHKNRVSCSDLEGFLFFKMEKHCCLQYSRNMHNTGPSHFVTKSAECLWHYPTTVWSCRFGTTHLSTPLWKPSPPDNPWNIYELETKQCVGEGMV